MTGMVLTHTNGSTAHAPIPWMRHSVQQFFSKFNWEDNPPEVQELREVASQNGKQSLSLTLKVNQFFSAIPWDGTAIAAVPQPEPQAPEPIAGNSAFTLEDFSDLF